jgi:hypothetical protein
LILADQELRKKNMKLEADKFVKVVEELASTLDATKLNKIDIAISLASALESQGVIFGADTAEEVSIQVTVDADTYENMQAAIGRCNASEDETEAMGSHGRLDAAGLLVMLAQDVAMTVSQPDSLEGTNMRRVLDYHGYATYV